MYTPEEIKALHKKSLLYFCTSLGFNFISLTKEERQKLDNCTKDLHDARLSYDIDYYNFFKDKK